MLGKASGYDLIRLSGAEQERRGVGKRDGLQAIGFEWGSMFYFCQKLHWRIRCYLAGGRVVNT